MKTLATGLILGTGAICIGAGLVMRDEIYEINPQIISGLCLCSVALLVSRFTMFDPPDPEE